MQRRLVSSVLLALAAALLLAPVAAAQDLTVWAQSSIRREQFAAIMEWYKEEQNPGIAIEPQEIPGRPAELTEKTSLAIASGAPPDLTWLEGSTVIELAAQGLLEDITRVIEDIRFTPADTVEMTYQGRMYGVPYHTTSRGLFKRVDLFLAAGLDPHLYPQSLVELWAWNQAHKVTTHDIGYIRDVYITCYVH